MTVKQIHELPNATTIAPEDQIVISTASENKTRRTSIDLLSYRPRSGSAIRRIGDKLSEFVSVSDFGAVGDGLADDTTAFQAALDAHEDVYVPRGNYRLTGEVVCRPGRRVRGAGRSATLIKAEAARAFVFQCNDGPYQIDPGATNDWNRSSVESLSIDMASSGIRAIGHEFLARELRFSGGQPSGWCIELENANECSLREIAAGTGGGTNDLLANGIRLFANEAGRNVNFGDSLLEEISIKLKSSNTTGILIEHTGSAVMDSAGNARFFVMNNILFSRVQINSANVPSGSVGIHLKRVMRSTLVNVDVEFVSTAFRVEGVSGGGQAGSVRHVSFINCYVLNCTLPWADSNSAIAGSVMRCFFVNCNGFSLLNPVGVGSSDVEARSGEGDCFLPGALWLPEPSNGQPAIQLRSTNPGQLIVAQDFFDGASGARDSNLKNAAPRRGLVIDASANDVTRIACPRGMTTSNVRRLEIGNGPSHPDGHLRYVAVSDPFFVEPRATEPPNSLNGMVINASAASALPATGTRWVGPGYYARVGTPSGGSAWTAFAASPGIMPQRERNNDFVVSEADFGWLHRVNHASDRTVTIPEGLVSATYPLAHFKVMRQGGGHVIFTASSGAILKVPGGRTRIAKQYQCVDVYLRWDAAWNNNAGRTDIFIPDLYPDADLNPSYGQMHRERNFSYTLLGSQLGELHRGNHGSADIIVTVPSGLWPSTSPEDVVNFDAMRVGNANFIIRADEVNGMTLRVPGTAAGVSTYDVNGTPKLQYSLALFEQRRVIIRKISDATGEVFIEGIR